MRFPSAVVLHDRAHGERSRLRHEIGLDTPYTLRSFTVLESGVNPYNTKIEEACRAASKLLVQHSVLSSEDAHTAIRSLAQSHPHTGQIKIFDDEYRTSSISINVRADGLTSPLHQAEQAMHQAYVHGETDPRRLECIANYVETVMGVALHSPDMPEAQLVERALNWLGNDERLRPRIEVQVGRAKVLQHARLLVEDDTYKEEAEGV